MTEFQVATIAKVAAAVSDDLRAVRTAIFHEAGPSTGFGQIEAPSALPYDLVVRDPEGSREFFVEVKGSEGPTYQVDFKQGLYRVGMADGWKTFDLPYKTTEAVAEEVKAHLLTAAKNVGEDAAMVEALMLGSENALGRLATRLQAEGPGRLAAWTIADILKEVTNTVVLDAKCFLENHSWGYATLRDAWKRLLELCVQAVWGKEYGSSLRRARRAKVGRVIGFAIPTLAGGLETMTYFGIHPH